MRNIITVLAIMLLILTSCSDTELEELKSNNEQLLKEIEALNQNLIDKNDEINELNSKLTRLGKDNYELKESINMIKASKEARLDDYSKSFYLLDTIYKIYTSYEVVDDWYIIKDESFKIELLGYEDAVKVEFYTLRISSDEGEILNFTDVNSSDGWIYENNEISKYINKQKKGPKGAITFEPTFVLYAKVILKNGETIESSKLPIYYY